jgi:DNA-directed RNA polymerase subunit N (RpoN/RPB10)
MRPEKKVEWQLRREYCHYTCGMDSSSTKWVSMMIQAFKEANPNKVFNDLGVECV